MAVKLRLTRMGSKKKPFYRVVAADSRFPRDGRFLERLGTYDPRLTENKARLKMDRINYWLDQGAEPTDTVRSLITKTKTAD